MPKAPRGSSDTVPPPCPGIRPSRSAPGTSIAPHLSLHSPRTPTLRPQGTDPPIVTVVCFCISHLPLEGRGWSLSVYTPHPQGPARVWLRTCRLGTTQHHGSPRFSASPQCPLPDTSRGREPLTGVGAFTTERLYPYRKEEPKAPTREATMSEQDQSWERRGQHIRPWHLTTHCYFS